MERNTSNEEAVSGRRPDEHTSLGLAGRIAAQAVTGQPNEGGTTLNEHEPAPIEAGEGAPPSNRAPSTYNPLPTLHILRTAIDSLYLSFQGQIDPGMDLRLAKLKEEAQHQAEVIQAKAQITIGRFTLAVLANGKKRVAYILDDHRFHIDIGRGLSMPLAVVQIKSQYLTEAGVAEAVQSLRFLVNSLGRVDGEPKVSRADLCADFIPPFPVVQCPVEAWVTRAKKRDPHYDGIRFTGWSIGKGDISARLYDKLHEVKTVSKKDYLFDLWRLDGWNGGEAVWRLEGQLRRPVLKELGVNSVDDLLGNLDGLWAYCFQKWLVLKLPQAGDSNSSRWPFDPLWVALQAASFENCGTPALIRGRESHLPSDEWLYTNGLAPITSLMARDGISDFLDGAARFFMGVQDHFQKRGELAETYVSRKVRLKARQFGTLNNRQDNFQDKEGVRQASQAYRKAKEQGGG